MNAYQKNIGDFLFFPIKGTIRPATPEGMFRKATDGWAF
jgi:hypothetical protein